MDQIEAIFGSLAASHSYIRALKAVGAPLTVDTLHYARLSGCRDLARCALPTFSYDGGSRALGLR